MKVEINAKNYQVNEKLREVIEKKLGKLDKYFDGEAGVNVYLKRENRDCKIEVELRYKTAALRAQAYAENFYDGIDLVVPKLEKQIYKHRSKLEKQLRSSAFEQDAFTADELRPAKIVKTKRFALRAMSIAEATEEFEMLGHTFYVFIDEADGKTKVLYLRDDGEFGLIEPVKQ